MIPKARSSGSAWLFAAIWGLAAVIITVFGLLYLSHERTLFRQSFLDQLSGIASEKVRHIVDWRQERLSDARTLMADPFLAQAVRQYFANPSDNECRAGIMTRLASVCAEGQSLRARLLDTQFAVRAVYPEGSPLLGPVARAFAAQAAATNQICLSDLHTNWSSGEIHLDVAIPLHGSFAVQGPGAPVPASTDTQTIGVIVIEIDPARFLYPVIQSWPTPSLTAETLLVRREGDEVLFLNELRHRKQTALVFRLPLETNSPATMALLGHQGGFEGVDYRGHPVVAALHAVPGTPWRLVAKIDQVEAFAALRRQSQLTLAAMLSLMLGAGLTSWAVWRHYAARRLANELSERKQREEQLRKLSRAVEQSPASIVITDRHGDIEYVNPKFCQLTGYTLEEARGQNPRMLKSGEAPPEAYRQLWETICSGREWRGEFHNKKKNGDLYWEFAAISPIADDAGQITHYLAVKEDITERKRTEKALAESEEKFRVQFETSRDATMLLDERGFFDCNRATLQMFGFTTREEFISKHPFEVSPPAQPDGTDSSTAARKRIEAAFATGSQFFEWQHRRSDGTVFASEVLLSRFVLHDKPVLQAVVRDTTERKRLEAELARERDLLATLFENTPDVIYFKDLQSRFVRCSHSFKALFKVTYTSRIIGRTDFDFFTKAHAQLAFEDEQQIMLTGEPLTGKQEQETHPDGRVTWALTSKLPWRDKQGRIIGTFGISKDITAIKEAEGRLAEAQKQLLETSRLAGMAEVATSILHNVGNVLNSVNVASSCAADSIRNSKVATLSKLAELLRQHQDNWPAFATTDSRGQRLPEFVSQIAEHMLAEQAAVLKELDELQKSVDHIKDIVITQQAHTKVSGVTEEVQASELVRDALQLNAAALASKDIRILEEFAPAPPLTVDRHKVLSILVNLIQNAKHACDDSGRPDKHLTLRVANGDGRIKISVIDNGVGIQPQDMTRIFNHGFTTRKNGHGFGLHSGALAARDMGGSLRVHSEGPGQGAVFTLELPLTPAAADPA